jgi:hypothetical protein
MTCRPHAFVVNACLTAAALTTPIAGHAQQAAGADASTRAAVTYEVAWSLALVHATTVDEALSLERYGGPGVAMEFRVGRSTPRRHISLGAGVGAAGSLITPRTTGGRPVMRFDAVDGRLDVQQRVRALDVFGARTFAGIALDGRYAERAQRIAAPGSVGQVASENRGQDVIVDLQPAIEFRRPLAGGLMGYRLGVGALGAVSHAWAPIGTPRRSVDVLTPPKLLVVDNFLTAERSVGRHAMIGLAYRFRLLRSNAPLPLVESRHDFAFQLGWLRGVPR